MNPTSQSTSSRVGNTARDSELAVQSSAAWVQFSRVSMNRRQVPENGFA